MSELWQRLRAVTLLQWVAFAAAFAAIPLTGVLLADPVWVLERREAWLQSALFAGYAILYRYAIASVEPLDGRPAPARHYVVACVCAAMVCGVAEATVIRPSITIYGHPTPWLKELWHGFFAPLVNGVALTLVHASIRNAAWARRGLQQAELARAEQARDAAQESVDHLAQCLDVEGLRHALLDIDREYDRAPALADRRIDELIVGLRARLRTA